MRRLDVYGDGDRRDEILRIPYACHAAVDFLASAEGGDGLPLLLTCGGEAGRCWSAVGPPDSAPLLVRQHAFHHADSLALAHLAEVGDVVVGLGGRDQLWRWEAASGRPFGDPVSDPALRHRGYSCPPLVTLTVGDAALAVTTSADGEMLRWDVRTGARVGASIGGETGAVEMVATLDTADGATALLSGGADGQVHQWDPISGRELAAPIKDCGRPAAIAPAIIGDGTAVLCIVSADGVLHRRDLSSGDPIGGAIPTGWQPRRWRNRAFAWRGFMATARCDGRELVAVAERTSVRLWDIVSGADAGAVEFPGVGISGIATVQLPDGTPLLIVSDRRGRVHRIDLRTREAFAPVVYPQGRTASWVVPTDLSDGRTVLTVVGELGARTYDAGAGGLLAAAEDAFTSGHPNAVALASLADGTSLLVAADEAGISRVDLQTGTAFPQTDAEEAGTIWDVATATLPDGRIIAAGAGHDGRFYRWDRAAGEAIGQPVKEHPISIKAVTAARSSDGAPMFITGCEAGRLLRWDAATGERIGEPLPGDVDFVTDLAVATTPDGRQFLACLDAKGLHRWNPATGERIGELIPIDSRPRGLFTHVDRHGVPSAFIIAYTNDAQGVEQWRLDTGEQLRTGLPAAVRAVFDLGGVEVMALGAPDGSLIIRPLPNP